MSCGSGDLGCPRDALHAAGIPLCANGHYPNSADQVTPEEGDGMVSLYVAGRSPKQVAQELGLPLPAVSGSRGAVAAAVVAASAFILSAWSTQHS